MKIKFICWLVTLVLALVTMLLASVVSITTMFGNPFFFEDIRFLIAPGSTGFLALSAWLAASSLDKLSSDPESMRVLGSRLVEVTEKVAKRARKAASRDQ